MIGWKSSVAQMQITRISIKNLFRYVLKKVYKTILILEYNLTSPLKNPNKKTLNLLKYRETLAIYKNTS